MFPHLTDRHLLVIYTVIKCVGFNRHTPMHSTSHHCLPMLLEARFISRVRAGRLVCSYRGTIEFTFPTYTFLFIREYKYHRT